ncbi:hypothetical protein BD408DRAFT_447658 [Parasitella parasitica]|nr:hypothetical protein BD408DRAFT_447658 [Parasitella parasitica]
MSSPHDELPHDDSTSSLLSGDFNSSTQHRISPSSTHSVAPSGTMETYTSNVSRSIGHLAHGADTPDVSVESNLSSLDFRLDKSLNQIPSDLIRSNVMSIEERNAVLQALFATVPGTLDDRDKSAILFFICSVAVMNGTSDMGLYGGSTILPGGGVFHMCAVPSCTDYAIRRFFRSLAAITYEMLESNHELASAAAEKWGMPSSLKCFAFDYADALTGLPTETRRLIQEFKRRRILAANARRRVRR